MLRVHDFNVGQYAIPMIIRGMRNSWESWEKEDSKFVTEYPDVHQSVTYWKLGEKDNELATRLIKAGDDHGKFLRQIAIHIDFTAPEYFLKEFDTYKVGTARNSTSMMHTLGKQPFDASMFNFEDMEDADILDYIDLANEVREKWILAGRKKPSKEWRAVLQITSQAWLYRSLWSGNYQVLRHMYHSRRNHKQYEWREFCEWMTTLPYSQWITVERN